MSVPGMRESVTAALAEDIGSGDATADLVPKEEIWTATVICRENAVLCGSEWFTEVFAQVDPTVSVEWKLKEGTQIKADELLCTLKGPARSLLSGERVALNFLQTLCGTATLAKQYADAVSGTQTKVLDTRKTIPGLRLAQKYAVACGGCHNHRIGLYDAILIKENHILAAGGIERAVSEARRLHPTLKLEVEVENEAELEQALSGGPGVIMLDNFDLAGLASAVKRCKNENVHLEASGNVNLQTIRAMAETGVDYISVGALTKDVRAVDLSMRFKPQG